RSRVFNTEGLTRWKGPGAPARSVVYVPVCSDGAAPYGPTLAAVALHELMHNKLRLQDAELHQYDGLAQASVGPGTRPSDGNVRMLAPVLLGASPQLCE